MVTAHRSPTFRRARVRVAPAAGFTLVEMMVVIAIVLVLAALAGPSFRELMASQRVQAAAMDLFTGLVRARSEAIKKNANVVIESKSGSTNWAGGWKVVADAVDLETHSPVTGVKAVGSASSLTYRSSGRIAGASPTFVFTATGTTTARCVRIELSGQPVVVKASAC